METKFKIRIATGVLAVLGVFCIFHITGRGQDKPSALAEAESKHEFLAFGVFGITAGQTVRLHAVALGVPKAQDVELIIYDGQGEILARSIERLHPGRPLEGGGRALGPHRHCGDRHRS